MLKRKETAFDQLETLIGKSTKINGSIHLSGTLRIEGTVEGDIFSEGDVVVGETGIVNAGIKGRNILIAGTIKGNVEAEGRIELTKSGKLLGDLKAAKLIVEEGALFKGNCQMEESAGKSNVKDFSLKETGSSS
jgi:cytoskeletal protein CcmA (bactofilin family)